MTKTKILILVAAAMLAASCAPTTPAPAVTPPQGDDRFLVHPRTGWDAATPPGIIERFDKAWRMVMAGRDLEAQRQLSDILRRRPDFFPARIAQAALDLRAGRTGEAREIVSAVLAAQPEYLAAQIYQAEIAARENQARTAYTLYRELLAHPNAPAVVSERVARLQEVLFNELYVAAQSASGAESLRLLREALVFQPASIEARVLLAERLVSLKQFDEARKELDPLLNTVADRPDVQSILAEVEAGRGSYEAAIVRYERLAKRTKDPRYERRLEEIKREWRAANMPAHFRTSLASSAVTRAELATLVYWIDPEVRFARNFGTPMIAVDIEDVDGRDEIIRAIALGFFDVDPVTRRVSPHRLVSASRFSAILTRLLVFRGAECARGLPAAQVLAACKVPDPLATVSADATIPGRDAAALLEHVARVK